MSKRNQPEKELQQMLVDWVRLLGGEVDSFSQHRRGKCWQCGARLYAGTMQTAGIPDMRCVFAELGVGVWVEVKAGSNKPTAAQHSWMEREVARGGFAVPVWSRRDLAYALAHAGVDIREPVPLDGLSQGTVDYVSRWLQPADVSVQHVS